MLRLRSLHGIVTLAALLALVVGSFGIVSLSARSFQSTAQATVSELAGFSGGGEHDGQGEIADEAKSPSSKFNHCFWMVDPITQYSTLICVPKPCGLPSCSDRVGTITAYSSLISAPKLSGASDLQAFRPDQAVTMTAQLTPEQLDSSSTVMSNLQATIHQDQPFTPHSRL